MVCRNRFVTRSRSCGFTYIGILLTIALLGTTLAAVGSSWSLSHRRALERELMYVGRAYSRAIESYYRSTPNGVHQYPRSLEDLIRDERGPRLARHLRELYADPLTGSADWRIITLPNGAIIGIASQSLETPLKQANFGPWEAAFAETTCFCDWQFVYLPQLVNNPDSPT